MLQPDFSVFPELTTPRLLLRKTTMNDAPEMFYLRSDAAILEHLGREPARDIKEAEEFIERITRDLENNDGVMWAIALKEAPLKMIGSICYWRMDKPHYRAEIGYALVPAYWRKGIMKEAIMEVLEYGFNRLGLHSVEARISPANIASAAILGAAGFIKEAHFKEDFFFRGHFEDTAVYSILQKRDN